jgi:hypothetical protein
LLAKRASIMCYDVRSGSAGEFADFLALEISRYKRLAEDMGLSED